MNVAFEKRHNAEVELLKWCMGIVRSDPIELAKVTRLVIALKDGVVAETEARLREPPNSAPLEVENDPL